GYQLLTELGAISEKDASHAKREETIALAPSGEGERNEGALEGGSARQLTQLGHELAKLPLDPKIARLLLAGRQYHCLTEILIIASALSVQDPRERPLDGQEAADAAHKRFTDERSDFLAYLKIWAWFEQAVAHKQSNLLLAEECRKNFLSPLRLREWRELHQQLHGQVAEMGMLASPRPQAGVTKSGNPLSSKLDVELTQGLGERAATYEQITKPYCAGCSATSA